MTNQNYVNNNYSPREKIHFEILGLILDEHIKDCFSTSNRNNAFAQSYEDHIDRFKKMMNRYIFKDNALENILLDYDEAKIPKAIYDEAVRIIQEDNRRLQEKKQYFLNVLEGMLHACSFIDPEDLEGSDDLDFEISNIKRNIQDVNILLGVEEMDGIDKVYQDKGNRL